MAKKGDREMGAVGGILLRQGFAVGQDGVTGGPKRGRMGEEAGKWNLP